MALAVWLGFFDSHSIYRRMTWQRDVRELQAENARLEQEIAELKTLVEEAGGNEVIERIAREQYGMRRPGETVYRVKPER